VRSAGASSEYYHDILQKYFLLPAHSGCRIASYLCYMSLLRFWLKKTAENHFFLEIFTKNRIFFLTDVFLIGRAGQPTILLQ